MAYKIIYGFYVPVVRQVPLRNDHSSENFSEEPMFIFFLLWKMIKRIPIKWLFVVVDDFGIFYKASTQSQFYMINVLEKSMVVCNLYYVLLNMEQISLFDSCTITNAEQKSRQSDDYDKRDFPYMWFSAYTEILLLL